MSSIVSTAYRRILRHREIAKRGSMELSDGGGEAGLLAPRCSGAQLLTLQLQRYSASSGRVLSSEWESGVHEPLSLPRWEGTSTEDSADHFATGGNVGRMTLQQVGKHVGTCTFILKTKRIRSIPVSMDTERCRAIATQIRGVSMKFPIDVV